MDKLIRSALILCFLWSCNVVQLATQGKTEVPDEFYLTDIMPFQTNPFTMTFVDTKNNLKKIEDLYPTSFTLEDSYIERNEYSENNPKAWTDQAWGSYWDSNSLFVDGTVAGGGTMITAKAWVKQKLSMLKIDRGGGDMYESVTWKAQNTLNSLCAVGLILGNELGLTQYQYPADGTYQIDIDSKAAYAMGKYCDTGNFRDNIGMSFQVVISTPANTSFYDKKIDMMGESYFIRYNSQTVNFAGATTYSGGNFFNKLIVANDLTSTGLRLEYVNGPVTGTGNDNDNDNFELFRLYIDTANNTGETQVMYKELHDAATDDTTIFFLGGFANTSGRINMKMISTNLSASYSDQYRACLTQSTWGIHTDNVDCVNANEVSMSTGFDSGSVTTWHFIVANWATAIGNGINSVGETSQIKFLTSTIYSEAFY